MGSRILGIWLPVFAFVSLGMDHVVANMFYLPLAIWLGAKGMTIKLYIWKGIIPAGLGNVVGGALFVGVYYWYLHLQGEQGTRIDVDGIYWDDVKDVANGALSEQCNTTSDEESKRSDGWAAPASVSCTQERLH